MKKFKGKWIINVLAVIELAVVLALCAYLGTLTACVISDSCEPAAETNTQLVKEIPKD